MQALPVTASSSGSETKGLCFDKDVSKTLLKNSPNYVAGWKEVIPNGEWSSLPTTISSLNMLDVVSGKVTRYSASYPLRLALIADLPLRAAINFWRPADERLRINEVINESLKSLVFSFSFGLTLKSVVDISASVVNYAVDSLGCTSDLCELPVRAFTGLSVLACLGLVIVDVGITLSNAERPLETVKSVINYVTGVEENKASEANFVDSKA